MKLALLTLGIVAFAVVLLCIKMILEPGKSFGSMHISGNPEMRKRGIHCVQSMDAIERRENPHRVSERRQKEK